jgi:hypothetical protein
MKSHSKTVLCLLAVLVIAGCASTQVSDRQQLVTGQLPRPVHIWVYDFAASPTDVPPESAFAGQAPAGAGPETTEQLAQGRKLGAQVAAELVTQIAEMGLPAEQAIPGTTMENNDMVIRGYFLSIQEGSAGKRIALGFGAGDSELRVAVEGFQVTPQGLRKLGSGTTESTGNKTPGGIVGLATMLATHNPAGLIISTGMKVYGQESGRDTIEGRAKATAKEIADVLKTRFQEQGWI